MERMNPHRYRLSKWLVALIVIVSPPIDMAVGYFLGTEQWPQFAVSLCLTIGLGAVYYIIYMWQLEWLSRKGSGNAKD